jgi:hypothetical protein
MGAGDRGGAGAPGCVTSLRKTGRVFIYSSVMGRSSYHIDFTVSSCLLLEPIRIAAHAAAPRIAAIFSVLLQNRAGQ